MRALYLVKTGKLEWRDRPAPTVQGDGEAIVRPLAAARCDLDLAVLRGEAPFRGRALHWLRDELPEAIGQRRIFRNAPFKGPYAFGHECVAEVVAVGDAVTSVVPGDRVVVPFQISCGACERCRRGITASCTVVPARSMYGFGGLGGHQWGGLFAERARVPFADAMLVKLPAGVDPVTVASASDNILDGHRAVAGPLTDRPRAPVLVVGGGAQSIGLYAAAIAVHLGAERVDYVDHDRDRLAIAERAGARAHTRAPRQRYPITVDASADPRGLASALLATEPAGLCTSVGIYYTPTTPIPLLAMYGNGVTFVTGRVNARVELPKVLALVTGGFDPTVITTRVAPWDQAPDALLDPSAKVILTQGQALPQKAA